jgi:hypothetical protein
MKRSPAALLGVLLVALRGVSAWQQWDYLSKNVSTSFEDWTRLWGYTHGPRSRRGHSMVRRSTHVTSFSHSRGPPAQIQLRGAHHTPAGSHSVPTTRVSPRRAADTLFGPQSCRWTCVRHAAPICRDLRHRYDLRRRVRSLTAPVPSRPRRDRARCDGRPQVLYGTRAVLFAGRDNEVTRNHVPRTYQIENINGSLEFTT